MTTLSYCKRDDFLRGFLKIGTPVEVHVSNGEEEFRGRGVVTELCDDNHLYVNTIRFRYDDVDLIEESYKFLEDYGKRRI